MCECPSTCELHPSTTIDVLANADHEDPADVDAAALEMARDWVSYRKQVRARLIALARANHPQREAAPYNRYDVVNGVSNNTIRKLYYHTADLSDERLLALATTTTTEGN